MKFLPLPDFDTVTSALNFDTPDCHVTGGCDLYTTKAAGPDKKLYKSIDRSLESQHAALVRFGASLSLPRRAEMEAAVDLSRSSPFGPLSEMSSRRTFAYLIATLNASHPDYDFSHVLRPQDFRRERSLRRAMADIDAALLSVRPAPPQAAASPVMLVDQQHHADGAGGGGGGAAGGGGAGGSGNGAAAPGAGLGMGMGGGAASAAGSGAGSSGAQGRRRQNHGGAAAASAGGLSKQSSSSSSAAAAGGSRRSATPAHAAVAAAAGKGSKRHSASPAPTGATNPSPQPQPPPALAPSASSVLPASAESVHPTLAAWGPHMWALVNREAWLDECSVFRYAPPEDPFADDDDGGMPGGSSGAGGSGGGGIGRRDVGSATTGGGAAIWSLHYFFFNRQRKRVAYLYARAVPVMSCGSPSLQPSLPAHYARLVGRRRPGTAGLTMALPLLLSGNGGGGGATTAAGKRDTNSAVAEPAEPAPPSGQPGREESAGSTSSVTKRARARTLLAEPRGAGDDEDVAWGANKRARFWLGDRVVLSRAGGASSGAAGGGGGGDEFGGDGVVVGQERLVWNRGDAIGAGYDDDDDNDGYVGSYGGYGGYGYEDDDVQEEEEEDEDEDDEEEEDEDEDEAESLRRDAKHSPVRGMSEDMVARMEIET